MAWSIVGVGSVVEVTVTAHTLTEPAGCAAGDLLVACIGSRIASTTSITLPSGWTRVTEQKINNVVLGTTGQASACIAYIIRGASAPALGFTHPATPNVARGQIVAYRENTAGNGISFDAFGGGQTATAVTAISIASSVTTTAAGDLLVGTVAGGSASTYTAFKTANAPSTASGATNTSSAPSTTTWTERADASSATGADIGLSIFDAVKTATGAGGAITATASVSSGHAVLMAAFRTLPIIADAWNSSDRTYTVTLSDSDKTATHTPAATGGIRSSTERTNGAAGKYYAEWVATTIGASSQFALKSKTSDIAAPGTESFRYLNSGSVFVSGTQVASIGAVAAGDIVCVAWDSGTERFWFRKNSGLWNNDASADPATGTNGLDASALPNTSFCLYWAGVTAAVTTLRTELAEYTQGIPSGFKSWMDETPASGGVTVAAVGVSAGSAVGTATVTAVANASFEATGVSAGSAVGTVSVATPVSVSFEAIGSAAAAVVGTVTATGKTNINAAGQSAATAVGTVSIVGNANVTATGISVGTAVGTVSIAGKANLTATGVSAGSAVGTPAVDARTNISTLATGQAAVSVAGDVTVVAKANVSVAAASVSAGAAVGTAGVSSSGAVSVSATSVAAPAAVGEVSIVGKANVTITGVAAGTLAGSPSVSGKAAVTATGVSAAAQTGVASVSTTLAVTVTPAGQTTTALTGSTSVAVGGGVSITPASVAAAALAGTAAVSAVQQITVAATGQEAAALAGSVSVSGGATVAVSSGAGTIVPPVYRPHTLTSYASRADTVMNKPAGTVENDILIAALIRVATAPGAADVVPPAGFTKIGTTTSVADPGGNNGRLELFWKRAGSSEPATYTFGQWASATTQGLMVAYSGCPTSGDPIDVYSQNSASTGSTATGLSVTTTQAQDNLLWLGHNWDASTTLTPPSGMTERADSLLYLSEQAITSAGATGNRTQTQASSNPWAVTLLALKGASGAAATVTALSGTASVTTRQTAIVGATGVTAPALMGGVSVATGGGISLTPTSAVTAALTGTAVATAKQVVAVAAAGQAVTALAGNVLVSGSVSVMPAGQAVASDDGVVTVTTTSAAVDVTVAAIGQAVQAEVGTVTVTTVALRGMDVWTGTAWASKPAKVWTGSAWVTKPVKLWNGSSWS